MAYEKMILRQEGILLRKKRGRFGPARKQLQASKTMEKGRMTKELVFTHN